MRNKLIFMGKSVNELAPRALWFVTASIIKVRLKFLTFFFSLLNTRDQGVMISCIFSKVVKVYASQFVEAAISASLSEGLFTWRRGTPGRWGNPPGRGRKNKTRLHAILQPQMLGWGFLRLSTLVLTTGEFEHRRPRLMSRERRKINSRTRSYLFMERHAFCYAVWGYASNLWLNTLSGIICYMVHLQR